MATKTKTENRPQITLRFDGRTIPAYGRKPSFHLRKDLRDVAARFTRDQADAIRTLPEALVTDSASAKVEYFRSADEAEVEEMLARTAALDDTTDIQTLMLCRVAIDMSKLKGDDPMREYIEADVLDENGEVSEFWAAQDWEEVCEFVARFRDALPAR